MHFVSVKVKFVQGPQPTFVGSSIKVVTEAPDTAFQIANFALADGHGDVTIDWGDGTTEAFPAAPARHVFNSPGTYVIRLSDDIAELGVYSASVYGDSIMREFASNAKCLQLLRTSSFRQCQNLAKVDVGDAAIQTIQRLVFANCENLSGELRFPNVTSLVGTAANQCAFLGCSKITQIHFAKANEAAITSTGQYKYDSTLGTGRDVCRFDL